MARRGHVRLCRDGATAARLVVSCRRVRGPLHVDELDVWKRRRRSLMMEGSLRARFVNAFSEHPAWRPAGGENLGSGGSGVLCMGRRRAGTVSNQDFPTCSGGPLACPRFEHNITTPAVTRSLTAALCARDRWLLMGLRLPEGCWHGRDRDVPKVRCSTAPWHVTGGV